MKVTKITQIQLKELIKEQAVRYKKVLELEARKEEITKQLNEMYGVNELDGFGAQPDVAEEGVQNFLATNIPATQKFGLRTDVQKQQSTIDWVTKHPALGQTYKQLLATDPVKAEKYIEFYTKFPTHKGQIKWDDARKEWADVADNLAPTTLANVGGKIGGGMSAGRQ